MKASIRESDLYRLLLKKGMSTTMRSQMEKSGRKGADAVPTRLTGVWTRALQIALGFKGDLIFCTRRLWRLKAMDREQSDCRSCTTGLQVVRGATGVSNQYDDLHLLSIAGIAERSMRPQQRQRAWISSSGTAGTLVTTKATPEDNPSVRAASADVWRGDGLYCEAAFQRMRGLCFPLMRKR